MTRFRGVILDVDGTLVDSNDAHAAAWVDAIKAEGYDASFEQVRRLIGKGGDKLLPEVTGLQTESVAGEAISRRRREIFTSRYLPRLGAFPETRALLERMAESGLKLAVASSAEAEELETLLDICGASELVAATTSSSDAERSKPDPDIVAAALENLGMEPGEVIMLGDTPYDVEAASRAGIALIGLRCGGWEDADLEGAIAIYDSPADLLLHFDDSPLGRTGRASASA